METQQTTHIIFDFFAADHDRLDTYLSEFKRLKGSDFPAAKNYFRSFLKGLKRHIVWEEDVLFPVFEKKLGMANHGPTAVMREEHRRIGAWLDCIHEKVRKADPLTDSEEEQLLEILGAHNQKEEKVLYPAIDQLISKQEAAEIFRAMEAIPAERYETCCGGHK